MREHILRVTCDGCGEVIEVENDGTRREFQARTGWCRERVGAGPARDFCERCAVTKMPRLREANDVRATVRLWWRGEVADIQAEA